MDTVSRLKEEELNRLNDEEIVELNGEINLEELIILGDEKKIPIIITFPTDDGKRVKAKALVKQLTLKELEGVQLHRNNPMRANMTVLETALFKQDGTNFTRTELLELPIGVVNAISSKIMELSGVDLPEGNLQDF